MIRHFCRLIAIDELTDDDVNEFYDVVTFVAPSQVVSAYTEQDDQVSVEVIHYQNDHQEFVYEILLKTELMESEGDAIMLELQQVFDFDFSFEASIPE